MENQDSAAQPINTPAPAVDQPASAPIARSTNPIFILILVLTASLVGVLSYRFGLSQGKLQPTMGTNYPSPTLVATPIGEPVNTSTPTASPAVVNWKQETNVISASNQQLGDAQYNFTFSYPDTWALQKTAHVNDLTKQNCADYVITNPLTKARVTIKMVCGSWSATYIPYPTGAEVMQKQDRQGNDGHTSYWLRRFIPDENQYAYYQASVSREESLTTASRIMEEVLISYQPDDWYFIPIRFSLSAPLGAKVTDSDLLISDTIIKSLKLNRK